MEKSAMKKTRPVPCEIVVVLDRSGSMEPIRNETIVGFNKFIDEQKAAPGSAFVSLYQFDDQHDTVYEGLDIRDVPPLSKETFFPRGTTALYDAIGMAIGRMIDRIDAEAKRRVILVVITDGMENASHMYSRAAVQGLVERVQARGWQMVFIGAGIDAIMSGGAIGLPRSYSINVAANSMGIGSTYRSLADNLTQYRSGTKADMSWEQRDRQQQDGAGAVKS